MVCVFFGHRDAPNEIKGELREIVRSLIVNRNVREFYVGDHGHFDGMARSVLEELIKEYDIDYCVVHAYIPRDNRDYIKQKDREDTEHGVYPEGIENSPPRFAVDYRNRWMVKKADIAVLYIKYSFGGAAKYANMAKRRGCEIINLGDYDFDGK